MPKHHKTKNQCDLTVHRLYVSNSNQTFYGKKFDFPPSRAKEGGCRS